MRMCMRVQSCMRACVLPQKIELKLQWSILKEQNIQVVYLNTLFKLHEQKLANKVVFALQ